MASVSSDPWARLGLRALVGHRITSVFWILFPVSGGLILARYGGALTPDTLLVLGLFLLLFEGILVYDLVLRNPILKVASVMPVHEQVVRRAYRQQSLLVLGALFVSVVLSAVAVKETGAEAYAPLFHISIPILVALPVYGGVLCQLIRNLGSSRQETRLGRVLGQELLPSDLSPVIYGASMVFGALGTWLLMIYFANRVWIETGTQWPLIVVISGGGAAGCAALFWSDKYGPPAIVDACARLVFLDRQGLLLASRHQKMSREISRGSSPASAAMLVRVQLLRRAPLYPLFVLFLALIFWSRSSSFGLGAMAAAVALGLTLDLPARWVHERLITTDLLQILGVRGRESGEIPFLRRELRGFALLVQTLVVGVAVLVGLGLGRPVATMISMGLTSWSVALFAGFFWAIKFPSGWPILRMLLILTALSLAFLPSGGMG